MILWPAIDVLGGRAVRLRAGRFDDPTVFHERPWELGRVWQAAGATALHVVDLDAARDGASTNAAVLGRIREATSLRIQLGGGLRSADRVLGALDSADRVVIGTLAVRQPAVAAALCQAHPGRIVVAVDARDGRVAIAGWSEATTETPLDLARRAASWGAAAVLYTDVSRDGLETGPDVDGTAALARDAGVAVLASGGVATLADLSRLAALRPPIEGVVVGRALLEGRFSLDAALAACR